MLLRFRPEEPFGEIDRVKALPHVLEIPHGHFSDQASECWLPRQARKSGGRRHLDYQLTVNDL
jgi:hypothetical protein